MVDHQHELDEVETVDVGFSIKSRSIAGDLSDLAHQRKETFLKVRNALLVKHHHPKSQIFVPVTHCGY